MRTLRQQLLTMLEQTRKHHDLTLPPKRLQAALIHHCTRLLPHPDLPDGNKPTALVAQTLSHGAMHRHLILIRCPDQAFYLDAIKGYLQKNNIQAIGQQTMVASMHCNKSNKHCSIEIRKPKEDAKQNFMFIALYLSATVVRNCNQIIHDMRAILRAVHLSVSDFPAMSAQIQHCQDMLAKERPDDANLLAWMNHERYILFGMQCFTAKGKTKRLGILRDSRIMEQITPELYNTLQQLKPCRDIGLSWLHLAHGQQHLYSTTRIDILRMDWIDHKAVHQHCILIGYFSRSARHTNASQVPGLTSIWQRLSQQSLLQHSDFYRREIRTLFDRMPKSLIAAMPANIWLKPLRQIVDLTVPTHLAVSRLTPTSDDVEYLLIAMNNLRFGPNVLQHIEDKLRDMHVEVQQLEHLGIGPHRIIIVAIKKQASIPSNHQLKKHLQACIMFWKDYARQRILEQAEQLDVPEALTELEQLPPIYQDLFPPQAFLRHYQARAYILKDEQHRVYIEHDKHILKLQILSKEALPLGELIDKIQAFSLVATQEAMVHFGSSTDKKIYINEIQCITPEHFNTQTQLRLQQALTQVLNQQSDHDDMNALLIKAGLDIEPIGILITLRNHLIQLMADAAPTPLTQMFIRYPLVAKALYHIFESIHCPAKASVSLKQSKHDFEHAMNAVDNLTDDRWFRALAALVEAGLRTNAYIRQTGEPIAIKINPQNLDFAPRPYPYREIFVHGIHMEGVHLRAGAVARGGIRYSDRPSDFRTEVLELMATQVVKNGQIVPTGAKGGFVVCSCHREHKADFVLAQYHLFIRSLLELTDNLIHQESVPPAGIHIHPDDQHDPYLVVAADKGTARFSDDANDEARLASFWLDDAFASGGKYGYDHKAFGITARGAWTCAAHHFKTLGKDAYHDVITTIGIGDMGGDVFGNGMLINPNLHLVGAFNHQHIFLDPKPCKQAFQERQRLFNAVKGWGDYNPKYIGKGGGVFERASKRIAISKDMAAILGISDTHLSGEALIRAMLKAPVDLLYNGGIGTYVKASHESHADVHDPSNNNVRVDANELSCTVVCEGGNLGFSQEARIEYAAKGGLINTDAIDNAAGVNMSDHEVNLKILFTSTDASHISFRKRNQILESVSDDVCLQCLQDNQIQAQALSLAQKDAEKYPPRLLRLRDTLLQEERLDRRIDPGLHDIATLYLRPQLAVLLGHEKNRIHEALDQAKFETWSHFSTPMLESYFPTMIQKKFKSNIHAHPLKAGICHTQVSNHIINTFGLMSIHHLESLLDTNIADICEALLTAECLLSVSTLQESLAQAHIREVELQDIQHHIQAYTLQFTEDLLRLFDIRTWDKSWFEKQHKAMQRFRKSDVATGVGGRESSQFLSLLKPAMQAGLNDTDATHLAILPELAQMAAACHLSHKLSRPLNHCLHAMQATLHLLPFSALEMPMRSSEWGSEDAHPLRREWLNRLTVLKARAGEQLLQHTSKGFLNYGEKLWSKHRNWQTIQQFQMQVTQWGEENAASDEQRRMHLMLALTQLESVIEDSASY